MVNQLTEGAERREYPIYGPLLGRPHPLNGDIHDVYTGPLDGGQLDALYWYGLYGIGHG